jgi:hypothetical protein
MELPTSPPRTHRISALYEAESVQPTISTESPSMSIQNLGRSLLGFALVLTLGAAPTSELPGTPTHDAPVPWGRDGHLMVGRAAAARVPADMPAFFRREVQRLSYLNYEPDRWRDNDLAEMNEAFRYDHYVDLENLPTAAREARDRFQFIDVLYRQTTLDRPERDAGFLPFRIVELAQRLETGFRRWRAASSEERAWIEERIVNDAGVLGHYVADGSNPHHTTIHFNGWSANAPNPRDFSTARDFHWRFESVFVSAAVTPDQVRQRVGGDIEPLTDVRRKVWAYLDEGNALVERLYELEQDVGFDPDNPHPDATAFALERLTAGAEMLRSVWYTAWVNSGR